MAFGFSSKINEFSIILREKLWLPLFNLGQKKELESCPNQLKQ
jgi:hypothetical protein